MNQKNTFGVACKTCRRRGRKCDRRLPTCANCSLRGAKCEGYVLRWVNAVVERKSSSDRKMKASDHETKILPAEVVRPVRKSTSTEARRKVASSEDHQCQTRSTLNTAPQIHDYVTQSNCPAMQDKTSRGFRVRQEQSWAAPIATITTYDGLEDLVRYCTTIPRRCAY